MSNTVHISSIDVALAFVPVAIVVGILYRWSLGYKQSVYAAARMLAQLLLVGYLLTYLFTIQNVWIPLAIMIAMVGVSAWIATHVVAIRRALFYQAALCAIGVGGGAVLLLILLGVFDLDPWYRLQYLFPLGGMTFANAMNSVSLAAERLQSEVGRNDYRVARNLAYRAALIPHVNAMLAAGIVSLPGTMTGQILSGVDPLIAVRYQIVVMCMVFGAAGLSTAIFLQLMQRHFKSGVLSRAS